MELSLEKEVFNALAGNDTYGLVSEACPIRFPGVPAVIDASNSENNKAFKEYFRKTLKALIEFPMDEQCTNYKVDLSTRWLGGSTRVPDNYATC